MKIILLTLLLSFLQSGHSLTCHKCTGCENTGKTEEVCREVNPATEKSLCLTQTIHMPDLTELTTVKKCAYFEKNKQFQCSSWPNSQTISCDTCQGDLCNSASFIKTSWYLYVSISLFLLVSQLYQH